MYFKYFDFLIVQALDLTNLAKFGPNGNRELYSFFQYTGIPDSVWSSLALFHIISYSLDVQQGKYGLSRFPDFLSYVSFFPHLIAGPIVRGNELIPQFQIRDRPIDRSIGRGGFITMRWAFSSKRRSRLDWSNNKSTLERFRRDRR